MKKNSRTALLFTVGCISLFSVAQPTQPQNCRSLRDPIKLNHIRGVVADENRGVIGRVKVTLLKAKGDGFEEVASLETNNVGRFDFLTAAAGKYRLGFQHRGFYFADVSVEVSDTGWDAFWLTMIVAPSDSPGPYCGDKYKVEKLDKSSFALPAR